MLFQSLQNLRKNRGRKWRSWVSGRQRRRNKKGGGKEWNGKKKRRRKREATDSKEKQES